MLALALQADDGNAALKKIEQSLASAKAVRIEAEIEYIVLYPFPPEVKAPPKEVPTKLSLVLQMKEANKMNLSICELAPRQRQLQTFISDGTRVSIDGTSSGFPPCPEDLNARIASVIAHLGVGEDFDRDVYQAIIRPEFSKRFEFSNWKKGEAGRGLETLSFTVKDQAVHPRTRNVTMTYDPVSSALLNCTNDDPTTVAKRVARKGTVTTWDLEAKLLDSTFTLPPDKQRAK
jgi:hypothetical protein